MDDVLETAAVKYLLGHFTGEAEMLAEPCVIAAALGIAYGFDRDDDSFDEFWVDLGRDN